MKTCLLSTTSPAEFITMFKKYYAKLIKCKNVDVIVDELVDVLINNQVRLHNGFVIAQMIEALNECATPYSKSDELAELLIARYYGDGHEREHYWAMKLVPKLIQQRAYTFLVDAIRHNAKLEVRANAMKQLSIVSKQPFDRDLPKKFSWDWTEDYIRMDEIEQWVNDGCPDGTGYLPPVLDGALDNPVTEFEKLVARLNNKLKKKQDNVDYSSYTNFLVVGDKDKLAHLQEKYKLTGSYAEFLTRFSPCHVLIEKGAYEIALYGVDVLEKRQIGYSVSQTGEPFKEWPPSYLVIADRFGDPYCMDLNISDSKIFIARHGEGSWVFRKAYNSFEEFLAYLAK